MSVSEVVPFLVVERMRESLRFYVDGLGFEVTNTWRVDGEIRWCRIQLGGAAIMLQQHADRVYPNRGEGVVLCLFCDDAVDLYRSFIARGVAAKEPYVGNRLWVTSVEDPDGYRLDFESPTDVPEETRLSDTDDP